MTLCKFRVCTLNTALHDESIAPYIMLEFLRQLSGEACYLFRKFFEALNTFLEGPRYKQFFRKQLITLACTLGQIHKALKSFDSGPDDVSMPVSRVGKRRRKTDFSSNSTSQLFTIYYQSHLKSSNTGVISSILQAFEQALRLRCWNCLVFTLSFFPDRKSVV